LLRLVLRKFISALVAAAALLVVSSPALAVGERQGITASPPKLEIDLTKGTRYSGSVNISNPGDTEYDFTVSAAPFSVLGEDYQPQFTARPDLVDASKWFAFPKTRFHVKPTQKIEVPFTISPPSDIAGGGYYAAVFAQAAALPGPGIQGEKRVGMVTYMTVAGDIHREGKLAGFTVPFVHTQPPLHTEVRLQNTGNVHYDSTVLVQVKDLFGNVKAQMEADHIIMPQTTRLIAQDWAKAPSFGLYQVTGTAKYLGKTENLPTRWTLMLSANAFLAIAGVLIAMGIFAFLTRRGRGHARRR
jgi:hypothetical protein